MAADSSLILLLASGRLQRLSSRPSPTNHLSASHPRTQCLGVGTGRDMFADGAVSLLQTPLLSKVTTSPPCVPVYNSQSRSRSEVALISAAYAIHDLIYPDPTPSLSTRNTSSIVSHDVLNQFN